MAVNTNDSVWQTINIKCDNIVTTELSSQIEHFSALHVNLSIKITDSESR